MVSSSALKILGFSDLLKSNNIRNLCIAKTLKIQEFLPNGHFFYIPPGILSLRFWLGAMLAFHLFCHLGPSSDNKWNEMKWKKTIFWANHPLFSSKFLIIFHLGYYFSHGDFFIVFQICLVYTNLGPLHCYYLIEMTSAPIAKRLNLSLSQILSPSQQGLLWVQ